MSIYPERTNTGRKNGKWRIDIVVEGKRKQLRSLSSYAEAIEVETRLMTGQAAKAPTVTLGWLRDQRRYIWSDAKDDQQANRLITCVDLLGPDLALEDVTTIHLHQLRAALLSMRPKRKCHRMVSSPQTLHRYLSAMSKALGWAEEQGHLSKMPSIPWPKLTEAPKLPYTDDEAYRVHKHLVDTGWPKHALIMEVLLYTGLRSGELWKLKPKNIADGFVGVGDWAGGTKTNDTRDTPISEALGDALRALIETGMPSYRSFLKALRRANEACGVDVRKTPHKLRHTTATRLTDLDVNAFVIQRYLGHRNIKTTLGYAKVRPKALRDAARLMEDGGRTEENARLPGSNREIEPLIYQGFLEASPGIEPGCKDLQAASVQSATPLHSPLAQRSATVTEASDRTQSSVSEGGVDTSWVDL